MKTKIIRILFCYHRRLKLSTKAIFLIISILWTMMCCHLYIITDTSYYSEDEKLYIEIENRKFDNNIHSHNDDGDKILDLGVFLNSKIFLSHGKKLTWIRQRIARLNLDWNLAFEYIKHLPHFIHSRRRSILIFPGLLSEYSVYNFAENAFKGGYLGELIQWSDLIAGLYVLGHQVSIFTSKSDIKAISNTEHEEYDIIFTDYIGLNAFREENIFVRYKCKIRVLDVYGTEPKFNFRTVDFNALEPYAKWNFEDTRQFYTFYPDTHDNTFLGFVVQNLNIENSNISVKKSNTPIAVIYGKNPLAIHSHKSNIRLIQLLSEHFEVHSTFREAPPQLPYQVINHGILQANEICALLKKAKLFVGMGYPYDGPGPFEALAEGTVFLQSKFLEAKNRENDIFFRRKPTSRSITSQHMYLERYVGEPYVYTIDISDTILVRETLFKILTAKPLKPLIPFEFSASGFLERLALLVDNHNFCDGPNVALNKRVNILPHFENNKADLITNGRVDNQNCYVSESINKPWIEVDLDTEIWIVKIRVTLSTDWAHAIKMNSFNSFKVSLFDFTKRLYVSKKFLEGRIFYVWDDINIPARYIQIEPIGSLNNNFMICGIEVFQEKRRKYWPDREQMVIKSSVVGRSCKDTCVEAGLYCERSLFPIINDLDRIKEYLNCSFSMGLGAYAPDFVDYSPAQYLSKTGTLGMCITNTEPMLFSCAGNYPSAMRVCPCVKTMPGQNGLPVFNIRKDY